MKLTDEQIDCAVEWWKKAISGIPKFDMGDAGEIGGIVLMLATLAHKDLDEKTIEAFGENLRKRLQEDRFGVAAFTLGVDYDPDKDLRDAFVEAGGDPYKTAFPWKTTMWFYDGGVQVRHGYGADEEELLRGAR